MSDKKAFVIRIDVQIYKALEKWAADEFRSVNGQIEWLLSQRLREVQRLRDPSSNPSKTPKK
ncbi:MAG: Arc family DNA binding domain-containing protein [Bacteroidota bacterium]